MGSIRIASALVGRSPGRWEIVDTIDQSCRVGCYRSTRPYHMVMSSFQERVPQLCCAVSAEHDNIRIALTHASHLRTAKGYSCNVNKLPDTLSKSVRAYRKNPYQCVFDLRMP